MGVTEFDQILEQHEQAYIIGTKREMCIIWPNCCHESQNTSIAVQVQDIKPFQHLRFHHGNMQTIRHMWYDCYGDIRVPDSYSAIIPASMPSLETLYDCCLDADHFCDTGPFTPLHMSFGKFAQRYCNSEERLPLVRTSAPTLHAFTKMYCTARPSTQSCSNEATPFDLWLGSVVQKIAGRS